MQAQHQEYHLPFGKHNDKPLGEVSADYLLWALRECKLSRGLRLAIGNELHRRNVESPPPSPPLLIVKCRQHPDAMPLLFWTQDRLGRRRIRAECGVCRSLLDHPPCIPPYTAMADRNASPAPILDALTQLDDLGIELCSDGKRAWVPQEHYQNMPRDLHALVRQCSHELAGMLGKTKVTP